MKADTETFACRVLVWLMVTVTAVGAVVWACSAPWAYDDWYYRLTITPGYSIESNLDPGCDPEVTTPGRALESIRNHFSYNGRLANFVHILLQPAGHTVEAVLMGMSVLLMLLCLCGIARGSGRLAPMQVLLCVLVLWVQYPWVEGMTAMSYMMNYIPPSVCLLAVVLWQGRYCVSTRALRLALCLLAFLAAWGNEGIGGVLGVYLAVELLMSRSRRERFGKLALLSAVAAGMAINMLLGTGGRAASQLMDYSFTMSFVLRFVPALWPVALATVLAVIRIWRSQLRHRQLRYYLPALCAMYAGLIPSLLLMREERVLWGAYLFASVSIIDSLREIAGRRGLWRQIVLPGAFVVVYALWMYELCRWQSLVGEETAKVEASVGGRRGGGPSVVYDHHVGNAEIPYWLMGVVHNPLDTQWGVRMQGLFMTPDVAAGVVLPPELEGCAFDELPAVPGANRLRGVWPMVCAAEKAPPFYYMTATFGPAQGQSPIERLMSYVKYGTHDDTISVGLHFESLRAVMADSTVVYRLVPEHLPRSAKHRPLLRVDTLE